MKPLTWNQAVYGVPLAIAAMLAPLIWWAADYAVQRGQERCAAVLGTARTSADTAILLAGRWSRCAPLPHEVKP